jgi:hypothetical protein
MSRIFMALLGLLAYKAFKGDSTQAPNPERKIRTLRHAGGCEEGRSEGAVIVPRPR